MARVSVFQGGNVQRQDPNGVRVRAADFGASAVGEGLKAAGQALNQAVEKQDQIEDVRARVEANRIAIEHSELTRQITNRVKQTLGEGAEGAADAGSSDLDKSTRDLLGKASPRARLLLENELTKSSGIAKDSFLDHGFGEKVKAFESTSVARISNTLDLAADEDDEDKARALLAPVQALNAERGRFFGHGAEWVAEEDRKHVSQFFKSRALRKAMGATGSASAAIDYATANRQFLSDGDFNSIISAYNDNAMDEMVASEIDGAPLKPATVVESEPGDDKPPRTLDPKSFFDNFTVPHEGAAYVTDSNGAGVKYGINAAYNPGVDVKNLTQAKAAEIFKKKYFEKSGADKLPPALAAVHVDTFYLNERQATKILKESGGDVDRYIELRREFLNGLAANNPAKFGRYKKGWENRTRALADFANRQGGDGRPIGDLVQPNTSLEQARSAIMARTDVGLTYKKKLIDRLEARRADERAERAILEEDADRKLTQAATALGENFTDIKQLPQDAWLGASPSTRDQWTRAAKSNVENKPLPLDVQRDIGYLRTFKPETLADPKVQAQLRNRGVPMSMLGKLAEEGGNALGRIDSAKPDPVARGTLESLARPHFEASGFRLWTQESDGSKNGGADRAAEVQRDAQEQLNLMGFLSDAAQNWALNNPGKQADEATMKSWIGTALIKTKHGRPIGTLGDVELYQRIPQNDRQQIQRSLQGMGLPVTPRNISQLYRRRLTSAGAWQR